MNNKDSFGYLFQKQLVNQQNMIDKGLYEGFTQNENIVVPVDDPKLESYHIQQLMSEIGEVLESDKRWKNFRNVSYDKDNKLEEIADCFIVLMNIAIFSGFDKEELYNAVDRKLDKVKERIVVEE